MTTVFDRMYRPGMSADEWHNLMAAVNVERRNDEYTKAYLESERRRKEREDSEMAYRQEAKRLEVETYNKRREATEKIKEDGKRQWASDMHKKWGW